MASTDKVYSVRRWDSYYNTWTMITNTGLTFYDAVAWAITMTQEDLDCYCVEYQVWVDCDMDLAQMVGYVEHDGYGCDAEFVECCC